MFLGIDQHGDVFTWGGKLNGSVRNSADKTRDDVPEKILSLHNIVDVSAGYGHVLALDAEGHVYAWGDNRYGQLGTDSKISRQNQVPIAGLQDIVQVAAGRTISLALKKDGTVLAWGQGLSADFNGKNLLSSLKPVPMVGLDDVVAIACGGLISESSGHNLALKADGTVWAWGHNSFGQLGDGTFESIRTTPTRVLELSNVVAIAAGDMHSLALKADGHLVGWGNNMSNQVGASTGGMITMPMAVEGL
jgi:alpha-tubulin suppressor-like RCC1 family protein